MFPCRNLSKLLNLLFLAVTWKESVDTHVSFAVALLGVLTLVLLCRSIDKARGIYVSCRNLSKLLNLLFLAVTWKESVDTHVPLPWLC